MCQSIWKGPRFDQNNFSNTINETSITAREQPDCNKIPHQVVKGPRLWLCSKIVYKISFLVAIFLEGGNDGGRGAIPTSFSIFDSYDKNSLRFRFGQDIFAGFKMPKLRGLQFHLIKLLKNSYSNFKD